MKPILTYIFRHNYYKEVKTNYKEALTQHTTAKEVLTRHYSWPQDNSFETKELISSNISEIRKVASWISLYNSIMQSHKEGLQWLFAERGQTTISSMNYGEYSLIAEEIQKIREYQRYTEIYNSLARDHREAIDRFLISSSTEHTHEEKRLIACNENEIQEISRVLTAAHDCESKYPDAWQCFSKGRKITDISLDELKTIEASDFLSKSTFLRLYSNNKELIKLILGPKLLPIESFSKEAIEQEKDVTMILASLSMDEIEKFEGNISLGNSSEHKRAILDSELYGHRCNFCETYSISQFYALRKNYDQKGVKFDDSVCKTKDNDEAIRAYNREHQGKGVVYIEDYLRIMTEGSDLYTYVPTYKLQKTNREEAKRIQGSYPNGFEALFGKMDIETWGYSDILLILSKEEQIRKKEYEIADQVRRQRELERKRQEEERKNQELRQLRSCVSSWSRPINSTVDCFSLYYYYPTTCPWNASQDEWEIRNLIWDFKASPNKPQSESEIKIRHENALKEVLPDLSKVMTHYFGINKAKLTLVCIPSSKRNITERRYKDLSEELCSLTSMSNGYPYVGIQKEGEPRHLGGTSQATYSIDSTFFKGRYVILFDDVITTGRSMERFKNLLEGVGAVVIGGISIGKTKHERQDGNPIDRI